MRRLRPFSTGQKMPDLIDTKLQKLGNLLSGRLSMPGDNRYAVAKAVPNARDSAYANRKAELLRWLTEEGRFALKCYARSSPGSVRR